MLTLADIFEGITGPSSSGTASFQWRPELSGRAVREVVIDSRQVMRGDCFVALPGERVDGHEFVSHALGRGAAVVLVQQDLGHSKYGGGVWVDARTGAVETMPA